jgi:hypothetical protein
MTEILNYLSTGSMEVRKLALLSLVVYINNLPMLKLQTEGLNKLSTCKIENYLFLNLVGSHSLINRADLYGFEPSCIPKHNQENKFLFNSMPLGRYPNGHYKIYREEDLIFLLTTKKFELMPDLSTCVIWVNLDDCDKRVKMILKLTERQMSLDEEIYRFKKESLTIIEDKPQFSPKPQRKMGFGGKKRKNQGKELVEGSDHSTNGEKWSKLSNRGLRDDKTDNSKSYKRGSKFMKLTSEGEILKTNNINNQSTALPSPIMDTPMKSVRKSQLFN